MSNAHSHELSSGSQGGCTPTCSEPVASGQLDLDSLRAAFPNWHLGGAPGYWFAVRGGVEVAGGPRSLLRCCLSADTLEALADKLCLQVYLDGLSDQELEGVWQHVKLPHSTEQAAS
jgi:hypothetical protein